MGGGFASSKQVPLREKISYGLSGAGSSMVFSFLSSYIMYYFTDVFGIGAAAATALFISVKLIDPFIDPVVGMLIDKTHTRWGKARPYLLWASLPFGLVAVMMFTTPALGAASKLIYAYAIYALFNICYSLISIPSFAILPGITGDNNERATISSMCAIFGVSGAAVASTFSMPLIRAIGADNPQKGFSLTMALYACIAVLLLLNGFLTVRERVGTASKAASFPFRENLRAMKNLPWIILSLFNFLTCIGGVVKGQSILYFLQYNLGRPELAASFMAIQSTSSLPALLLSSRISRHIGKRNTCALGIIIGIAGGLVVLAAGRNIPLLYIGSILNVAGFGLPSGVMGAMFADTIDYAEWKTGRRAQGILSMSLSLAVKMGTGLGGAFASAMLALGNYIPNAVQLPSALQAIEFNFLYFNLITGVAALALVSFYKLDKHWPRIERELNERREISGMLDLR
jgi:GPH family glycoside/pentoside/hexuronide:cation symporter